MRFALLALVAASVACSSELHTVSQIDATTQKTETAHAEEHAKAQERIEDHSEERQAEAVVTSRSGGAVDLDVVTTRPDGTRTEKHFHRAPIEVKRDATKTAAVQKAISADATSLLDAHEDAAAKTVSTVKATATKEKESKPSLGFLAGLMPWLLGLGAVLVLVALSVVTKTNPLALAGKVVLWAVAKLRGQPSAG